MDDHRRLVGADDDDDAGGARAGNSASMRPASDPAPPRSLVHSARAAAKGSAVSAWGLLQARRRRACRWWRGLDVVGARSGGGSGSGVGAEDGVPAPAGRRVLGMPGWCSQENGTEVVVVAVVPRPRGEGDGEDAADDTVERDDEDDDDDEKVRWRRRVDAGEDEAVAVVVVGGGTGAGVSAASVVSPVGMGGRRDELARAAMAGWRWVKSRCGRGRVWRGQRRV